MNRFAVQPRSYICSANSDAVIVDSKTADTRLILINPSQSQRCIISASNDKLIFTKGQCNIAIMGITDDGVGEFAVPDVLRPGTLAAYGLTASVAQQSLTVSEELQLRRIDTGLARPVFASLTDENQKWFIGSTTNVADVAGGDVKLTLSPESDINSRFAVQNSGGADVLVVDASNVAPLVTVTGQLAVDGRTQLLAPDGRSALSLGDGIAKTPFSRKMLVLRDFNEASDHQFIGAGLLSDREFALQVPTTNGHFSFCGAADANRSEEWAHVSQHYIYASNICASNIITSSFQLQSATGSIDVTGTWLSNVGKLSATAVDCPIIASSASGIIDFSRVTMSNVLDIETSNLNVSVLECNADDVAIIVTSDLTISSNHTLRLASLAPLSGSTNNIDCGAALMSNLSLVVDSIEVTNSRPMRPLQTAPVQTTFVATAGQREYQIATEGFFTVDAASTHVHINGRKLAYIDSDRTDYTLINGYDDVSNTTYFTIQLVDESYADDVVDIVMWPAAGGTQVGQNQLFQALHMTNPWTTEPFTSNITFNYAVGIGTSRPQWPLQVDGTISATEFRGNMEASNIVGTINTARLPSDIRIAGNFITTLGDIGVGTEEPAAAIDVVGDIHATGIGVFGGRPLTESAFIDTTDATNIVAGTFDSNLLPVTGVREGEYGNRRSIPHFTVDPWGRIHVAAEAGYVADWNASIENSNTSYTVGNVAIGTTDASMYRFTVNGDAYFKNGYVTVASNLSTDSFDANTIVVSDSITVDRLVIPPLASKFEIRSSGNKSVLVATNDGAIGINTTVCLENTALTVNGVISADALSTSHGIIVLTNASPTIPSIFVDDDTGYVEIPTLISSNVVIDASLSIFNNNNNNNNGRETLRVDDVVTINTDLIVDGNQFNNSNCMIGGSLVIGPTTITEDRLSVCGDTRITGRLATTSIETSNLVTYSGASIRAAGGSIESFAINGLTGDVEIVRPLTARSLVTFTSNVVATNGIAIYGDSSAQTAPSLNVDADNGQVKIDAILTVSGDATFNGSTTATTVTVTNGLNIFANYGDKESLTVDGVSGLVGIGTTTSYTGLATPTDQYSLAVAGRSQFANTIYAMNGMVSVSDSNIKKDIIPIEDALAKISRLTGYSYTRRDTERREVGLIAQEVQSVLPEVVRLCDMSQLLTISYGNMAGLFVEALKALSHKVDRLVNDVAEIRLRL